MLFDHSLADGVEVDEFGVQTFYFDRHAPSFPALLYFYQKKEMVLYRPLDVPMGWVSLLSGLTLANKMNNKLLISI